MFLTCGNLALLHISRRQGKLQGYVLAVDTTRKRGDVVLGGERFFAVDFFAFVAYTIVVRQLVGSVRLIRLGGTSFGLPSFYFQLNVIRVRQQFFSIVKCHPVSLYIRLKHRNNSMITCISVLCTDKFRVNSAVEFDNRYAFCAIIAIFNKYGNIVWQRLPIHIMAVRLIDHHFRIIKIVNNLNYLLCA